MIRGSLLQDAERREHEAAVGGDIFLRVRFRDVAGRSSSGDGGSNGFVAGLVKSLVRDTVVGILLWQLYEQIKGSL